MTFPLLSSCNPGSQKSFSFICAKTSILLLIFLKFPFRRFIFIALLCFPFLIYHLVFLRTASAAAPSPKQPVTTRLLEASWRIGITWFSYYITPIFSYPPIWTPFPPTTHCNSLTQVGGTWDRSPNSATKLSRKYGKNVNYSSSTLFPLCY